MSLQQSGVTAVKETQGPPPVPFDWGKASQVAAIVLFVAGLIAASVLVIKAAANIAPERAYAWDNIYNFGARGTVYGIGIGCALAAAVITGFGIKEYFGIGGESYF